MAARRTAVAGAQPPSTVDATQRGPGISRGLNPDKVLEAAESMLAHRGLAAFRVRDVAAALDVQPQAIYNYFPGREGLLRAVSERFIREINDVFSAPVGAEPWDELRISAKKLATYMCAKPTAAYLALADVGQWSLTSSGPARDIDVAFQKRIKVLLGVGINAGLFRPIRPQTFMAYLFTGIAANVLWNDRLRIRRDRSAMSKEAIEEEAVDLAVRLLVPGIVDPAGRGKSARKNRSG